MSKNLYYTEEMIDFIRNQKDRVNNEDLTMLFNNKFGTNKTASAVRAAMVRNGMSREDKTWRIYSPAMVKLVRDMHNELKLSDEILKMVENEFGVKIKHSELLTLKQENKIKYPYNPHAVLNPNQQEFALKHYKGRTTKELSEKLNERFGLSTTQKQMREWLGSRGLKNEVDTRFGSVINPANADPIGKETHAKAKDIVLIKVGDRKYERKHRVVWTKHYGRIPDGHDVIHLDRDKLNNNIHNLALVSKKASPSVYKRVGLTKAPELNRAIINYSELMVKIGEIDNGKKD